MKKLLGVTLMVLLIAGTASAQDAWYEAAEACAENYEISIARDIPGENTRLIGLNRAQAITAIENHMPATVVEKGEVLNRLDSIAAAQAAGTPVKAAVVPPKAPPTSKVRGKTGGLN